MLNTERKHLDDKNSCIFMTLPKCMRQDQTKLLDLAICNACAAGRIEGHLFALREELQRFVAAISRK